MNLYMKAVTDSDTHKLAMKFYLLGHLTAGGYTKFGESDTEFMFQSIRIKGTLTMILNANVDVTAYDNLMIVLTATNIASGNANGVIYFQSLNTYSHIHTTLV